jgi:hypothetical protein
MKYYFNSVIFGILLIAVGTLLWLSKLGVICIYWHRDWPVILIAVGIIELVRFIIKRSRHV